MTESEPLPATPGAMQDERRLHPLSWLFALLTQLRSMVLPAAALLLFGKGDAWIFAGLIGAAVFALYAFVYSYSFRYRIGPRELLVRSGIFSRTERHVPYERIQNIVQKRNVLHRLFDVTELRLESAGGSKPEAVMSVITLAAAAELERVLKRRGDVLTDADPGEDMPLSAAAARLEIGHVELLRLGLLNDRGWVAVSALVAFYWQFGNRNWDPMRELYRVATEMFGVWSHAFASWTARALSVLAIALLVVTAVKLLSIVMAVLSFYRFRLSGDDERLTTEAGLLTRHVASARRDKIQRLIIDEGWLARRIGRRRMSCEVAAGAQAKGEGNQPAMRLRWLAPIGNEAQIVEVANWVVPGLHVGQLQWRPLHPHAGRRKFKSMLWRWSLLFIPAIAYVGVAALFTVPVAVLLCWLYARGWARFAAYACEDGFIAFRAGWLHRRWTFARIDKGQTLSLTHSPFDRRRDMQTLAMDTAGVSMGSFALSIPYLPTGEARDLAETLRSRLNAP